MLSLLFIFQNAFGQENYESFIESGVKTGKYSSSLGDEQAIYSSLSLKMSTNLRLMAEVVKEEKFNSNGEQLTLGFDYTLNEDWYAQGFTSYSHRGTFFAESKIDMFIYNKSLFDDKSLILGLGLHYEKMKDEHYGQAISFHTIYYTGNWIFEGGLRFNQSYPGNISSNGLSLATTYVWSINNQRSETVLYLEKAEVAYKDIGSELLINYPANVIAIRHRQWFSKRFGGQFSLENEHNPYFNRNTLSLGIFYNF